MAERTSVLHPYAAAITSALFGVAVAAYLSVEYLTGQAGLCLTGSGCDAVRASAFAYPFAYPFGVPLPRLGVAFFLTAGWLVWRSLSQQALLGVSPRAALLGWATLGLALAGLTLYDLGDPIGRFGKQLAAASAPLRRVVPGFAMARSRRVAPSRRAPVR